MDANHTTNTSPVTPTVQQASPDRPKIKLPFIVGVMLLLLFVGSGAYFLGVKNASLQKSIKENAPVRTSTPTNSINPTLSAGNSETEIISVDDKTNKYFNTLGFSIKYPKYNQVPSTCQERQKDKSGTLLLKVFEEPSVNSLYISDESVIEVRNKQAPGGGYMYDFSTCKVVPNNLDLIKNGYDNGMSDSNGLVYHITKPNAFQINYKKIVNDNDLNDLLHTIYGSKCFVSKKELDKKLPGVYDVKFADKNGNNGFDGECVTNYGYYFYYAPKSQVGVITSGFQNPPFNGTNGQYEPGFEFPAQ